MQEPRSETRTMSQRRIIHFLIRGILLCLGIFLLWKMVSEVAVEDRTVPIVMIAESEDKFDPILVEVYYESMCPDSKYFINHKLVPVMTKLSQYLMLRLIPYGKATTYENNTGIYFTCQHSFKECQGNKVHACAIHTVEDQRKLLSFVSCLISNIRNPWGAAENCAKAAGVEWDLIKECASGRRGGELLKGYGEETHGLYPPVSFIPTIALNKSQENQQEILKDLFKQVCLKFGERKPAECT